MSTNLNWYSIKEGDEKAFEQLYHHFYAELCAYAYSICNERPIAEEVVQDCFFNLWTNRKKIEIRKDLAKYLFRAVHNETINRLKSGSANKKKSTENPENWDIISSSVAYNAYLVEKIEAEETEHQISQIIGTLPEQCREVFIKSRFDGLSNQEIAEKMNLSVNTVRTHIYRALHKISEILD